MTHNSDTRRPENWPMICDVGSKPTCQVARAYRSMMWVSRMNLSRNRLVILAADAEFLFRTVFLVYLKVVALYLSFRLTAGGCLLRLWRTIRRSKWLHTS